MDEEVVVVMSFALVVWILDFEKEKICNFLFCDKLQGGGVSGERELNG